MNGCTSEDISCERVIIPPANRNFVENKGNPLMGKGANRLRCGAQKPLYADGLSSNLLTIRNRERVKIPASSCHSQQLLCPPAKEDTSRRGEVSIDGRNLSQNFRVKCLESDDIEVNGTRNQLPMTQCSIKLSGNVWSESIQVPVSSSCANQVSCPILGRSLSKNLEQSKVKFIPAEEAALLSSGAKTKSNNGRLSSSTSPCAKKVSCVVPEAEVSKACLQKRNSISICRIPPGFERHVPYHRTQDGTSLKTASNKTFHDSHSDRYPPHVYKPSTSEKMMDIDAKIFIPRSRPVKSVNGSSKVFSQTSGRIVRETFSFSSKHVKFADSKVNVKAASTLSNNDFSQTMNNASDVLSENVTSNVLPICEKEQTSNDHGSSSLEIKSSSVTWGNTVDAFDGQIRSHEVQTSDSLQILSIFLRRESEDCQNLDAIWKGDFEIHAAGCLPDLFEGIEAHRPTIVSCKVCEVSKQMPQRLLFKLQHRLHVWPRIFFKDYPTAYDIALYFLPREVERKKYFDLTEKIEMEDLAMQSFMDGMELLIFSSKLLPVGCQRLDMHLFLWGIFRRVKNPINTLHDGGLSHNLVIRTENMMKDHAVHFEDGNFDKLNFVLEDCGEELDMEIDMIGGKDVGRTDKPVPGAKSIGSLIRAANSHCNEVSTHHQVSSNKKSPLRCKRVRFAETCPSNLEKITDTKVFNEHCTEKEIEHGRTIASESKLELTSPSVPQYSTCNLPRNSHHGPNRILPVDRENGLRRFDLLIPDVPPGFSKRLTNETSQCKLNSSRNKPPVQKAVDISSHCGKTVNSRHEFCSTKVGKVERLSADVTCKNEKDVHESVNVSGKRAKYESSISKAIIKNENYEDRHMVKEEKDEYLHSFETREAMYISAGPTKLIDCVHDSPTDIQRKEKDNFLSSDTVIDEGIKEYCQSQSAYERKENGINLSESKDQEENKKSLQGSTVCENHVKDAVKIEYASSKDSVPGLEFPAQKSLTSDESTLMELYNPKASDHVHVLHPPRDTTDSMPDLPTPMGSKFRSEDAGYLQLFPLDAESTALHVMLGADGAVHRADNHPMNEESLVLSLARPQYINDGNKWINLLSKEELQVDVSDGKLQLSL